MGPTPGRASQIHPVSFESSPLLTNVLKTFISANKQLSLKNCTKALKVGPLFDFNLKYRSIYATFKLLAQFLLLLLLEWNNNYSGTIEFKELLRKTTKTCQFKTKKVL